MGLCASRCRRHTTLEGEDAPLTTGDCRLGSLAIRVGTVRPEQEHQHILRDSRVVARSVRIGKVECATEDDIVRRVVECCLPCGSELSIPLSVNVGRLATNASLIGGHADDRGLT